MDLPREAHAYTPEESYQDVVALSFWMTIKNALAGIPAGGAKGGIVADTLKLSDSELERVCRNMSVKSGW